MNNASPMLSLQLQFLLLLVLSWWCYREGPVPASCCHTVIDAFTPPRIPISTTRRRHTRSSATTETTTTTTLFGLRTKAKDKIASLLTRSKLPSIVGRTRWQSVDIVDKQPDDDDESSAVLQGTTTPFSADIATPIVLEVEETITSPQQYSDHDKEQQVKNKIKTILAVEGLEKRVESQIDEAGQGLHEEEELDLAQYLPSNTISLVHLPPLSPHQQEEQSTRAKKLEFRNHFLRFERYSQRDVALLKSPRLRIVLSGLAATPLEPAVYKSLEILYQDLMPLRYAGRFIFKRLESVIEMCVQARRDELQMLRNNTSLSIATLEVAQLAFSGWVTKLCSCDDLKLPQQVGSNGDMENDREHDLVLSTSRLFQSPSCIGALKDTLEIIIKSRSSSSSSSNPNNIQHWAALLDPQETGTITFPQFVYSLQQLCDENGNKILMDDDDFVLNQVSRNILIHVAAATRKDADAASHFGAQRLLDPARQAYSDRFDEMVASIREWQKLFFNENSSPSASNHHIVVDGVGDENDQTRRWQVLKGCCVGAENAAIREALRICYVDNAASRISGNIIFALVSALIPKEKR